MKKVLVNIIRNKCAEQGGTSIFSLEKLVTIINGEHKEYKVTLEHGSEYVMVEE